MAYFTRGRMDLLILELCEANERFEKGPTGDKEADIRALIECQQKALVLGEYIESMGMDYSTIVSKFSKYCCLIYEIAEHLDDKQTVIDNQIEINNLLWRIMHEIDEKIIEISSIDIYDFSKLVSTKKEGVLVSNEINRLIDDCLNQTGDYEWGDEYSRQLVLGTY